MADNRVPRISVTLHDHKKGIPVIRRTIQADALPAMVPPRRDVGSTFIELLVSIVLLGTVVIAVLAALMASVRGSVTHEEKVDALAVLESAAAALKEPADPCTAGEYRSIAASAVSDSEWADNLEVVSVDCSSTLHEVQLRITAPRGLKQTLDVTVGGPRVADSPGGGEFDDSAAPIVTCAVTNVVATPGSIEVSDLALLTSDVRVLATTDAICSGTLRARFSPAPIDPATSLEWEPPFQEIADRQYELILTEGTFAWAVGTNDMRIDNELPTGTAAAGYALDFLELTCHIDASVDNPTPTRRPNGRLSSDVTITVTPSPACDALAIADFVIQTGSETFTDSMSQSGGSWFGVIPGQEDAGPVFTAGPKVIEVLGTAGAPIATIPIEVS